MKGINDQAISGPMFDLIAEVRRQEASEDRIKDLLDSGLFSDLLKTPFPKDADRSKFRKAIGIPVAKMGIRFKIAHTITEEMGISDLISGFELLCMGGMKLEEIFNCAVTPGPFMAIGVNFSHAIWTEDIIELLTEQGLRLGRIDQLLEVQRHIEYPDEDGECLVGLGTVGMDATRARIVPAVGDRRFFTLAYNQKWDTKTSFLVFKER